MKYHALISPRGCVEYNAEFVLNKEALAKLQHGKWYAISELPDIKGPPLFLKDSSNATEKNIKKWRYERQEL